MADVKLEGVVKRYGAVTAVQSISMHCADGEFLALLGPSGCGKSSTMRMIAGLEDISEGSIHIGGRRVNDVSPADRNVAMAFENFGLYPHRTVFGNIAYPLTLRKRGDEAIANAVVEVAALLGIDDILDRYPRELPVGANQRVSLARALVREPSVFLMDEPLSHVDAELRASMRSEVKRLHQLNGSTTIYVTHDQLEALTMADRIVVMHQGVIQQIGTPEEVYERPANRFVATFIGEPPMNILPAEVVTEAGVHTLRAEGADIELPVHLAAALRDRPAREIDLGVRPDHFRLAGPEHDGIRGTVRVREIIGSSALLAVDTDGARVRVRLDAALAPTEGSAVRLRPEPSRIALFERAGGESLSSPIAVQQGERVV